MPTLASRIRTRFLRFRREFVVVAFALGEPGTPWTLRLGGGLALAYLFVPVDLIPIMVPFLGLVDDAILVPWGLSMVVRRLPPAVRTRSEERTTRFIGRWVKRPLLALVVVLVGLFTVWMILLWLFFRWISGG